MGDQATSGEKKRVKPGILRLDISKPRRSSGGSVEFRPQVELLGEVSPSSSTSPPHLSVTWASECDVEGANSPEPRQMQENSKSPQEKPSRAATAEENPNELSPNPTSPVPEGNNSGEEDYSVSVSAIMQRRASIRGHRKKGRGSRRASSAIDILEAGLYGGDRRRSSVFTTSSGDTAISVEDGTNQGSTQEQIYENIRLHKEVIQSVKHQPWSIRRKVKLVRQAKTYIARHEGALQERFAMSRNTKDLWARCKIVVAGRWKYLKREIASYLTVLIPWELRIKQIESHFGSGVASYFTFLRWLLWVNIMMAIPLCAFVIIPELLASDHQTTEDRRKRMTKGELKLAGNILKIWEFEGYLKYSPLFYGYYSHFSGAVRWGYDMPLAYFLTTVAVYMYSFFATLKKMAQNSRLEKLSSKDDECVFSWKLFTGWDFMIGHAETAHNRIASVVVGFKEALLEEAEKKKDKRNWKVIVLRILVNIVVVAMLAASGYCIVIAVDRSENVPPNSSWLRRNEVNVIMTSLSFFLPMIFECFGLFENWHPRQQLRLQLARIMILNLLNLYSLMFGFIYQITAKDESQQLLKNIVKDAKINRTHYEDLLKIAEKKLMEAESPMTDDWFTPTPSECTIIYKNCSNTGSNLTTTLLLLTTMLPGVWNRIDPTADVGLPNYEEIDKMHENDSYFDYYDYFDTYVDNPPDPGGAAERSIRDVSLRQLPSHIKGISPSEIDYQKPAVVDAILGRNSRNVPDISSSKSNEISEQEDVHGKQKELSLTEMLSGNSLELTKNVTANSSDEEQNQIETFEFFGDKFQQLVGNTTTAVTDYYDTDNSTATTPDDGGNCTIEICLEDLTTPMYEPTTTPKDTTELREAIAIYQDSIRNATEIINDSLLNLSKVCWETTLGQELSKVIVFDTLMSIALPLIIDFFRALFVRYVNHHWCWDMEKTFPQYGDFKIAESILNLVYNQGQVWMGIFFSPGLVIINLVKLVMLMYLRSWIVLTCNVPHELVFKASKSNNFYLSLLLTMLFLCVLPVGFAIVWLSPSTHCGPFSKYSRVSEYFTTRIKNALPDSLHKPMEYITSSSTVIPLLLLLILIIYYLISLTGALREANQDLRNQLQKERMEERKKMLSVPDEKTDEQEGNGISSRWKKVLDASSPVTPTGPNDSPLTMDDSKALARKEMLSRIMKHALRKGSETSDDLHGIEDDETDNEHDPLPHDGDTGKRAHKTPKVMKKTARKPSILDIVQMAKKESAKEPHPKGRFKINREVADAVDSEAEAKMKAVSERRRSLLKRQAKVSENLGYTDDPNSNYEVVNEKNKEVEKRQSTALEPDVFKYDTRSMQEEKTEKEVQEQRKRARSDVFPKTPTDPSSSSNGSKFSTLTKGGRKKLGSFLALVKEAVNTKKIETEQEAKEDSNPEDQRKDSLDKVLTKTEETTSEGTTDTRRDSESDRPKRNDSQGSIWSDNIPVITISKTEGQEMILECSDIEADNYKSLETHDEN